MNLAQSLGSAVADAVRPTGTWHQLGEIVIEHVRETIAEYDPVRFERWETQDDERTCALCGPIDGIVWQEGEGFFPPVHDNCRCQRVYDHLEFRVRFIEDWRDVAVTRTTWQWRQA